MEEQQRSNEQAYAHNLASWVKERLGKFVAIREGKVLGFYDNPHDALVENGMPPGTLVKKIEHPDLAGTLARSIHHVETALSLANVQATNITLDPTVVRVILNAAKQLDPMCQVADAADAVHTQWSGLMTRGFGRLTSHEIAEVMQGLMVMLGKKLWDALPDVHKRAYQGMAVAMDENGNVLEDFDGNPLVVADALERLDKVAVNPLVDLIEKAERMLDLMVDRSEGGQLMILREIEVESIVTALRELRTAVDRMTPWKSRRPE